MKYLYSSLNVIMLSIIYNPYVLAYNDDIREKARIIRSVSNDYNYSSGSTFGFGSFFGLVLIAGIVLAIGAWLLHLIEEQNKKWELEKEAEKTPRKINKVPRKKKSTKLKSLAELQALENKIKASENGNLTYRVCIQYCTLAETYAVGDIVEKDTKKAEDYFDSAIKYASELYSAKTRDRKKQEFIALKNKILSGKETYNSETGEMK